MAKGSDLPKYGVVEAFVIIDPEGTSTNHNARA